MLLDQREESNGEKHLCVTRLKERAAVSRCLIGYSKVALNHRQINTSRVRFYESANFHASREAAAIVFNPQFDFNWSGEAFRARGGSI